MNTKRASVIILLLALSLAACGKEAPAPQQQPVKKAPAPQQQAAAPAPPQQAQPEAPEARHRNPFQSQILLTRGTESKKIRGPLQCCELNQFKVLAIALSPEGSFALIQAPDTKRYVVRQGDILGSKDGKVVRFDARGITVREYELDDNGKVKGSTDIELKLPDKVM